MRKKIQMIGLVILMLIPLIGCRKGKQAEAAAGPVTINFVHFRTDDVDIFRTIIANFEAANPGIKINMDVPTRSFEEYYTILRTRFMGGDDPQDIFGVHPDANLREFANNGIFTELVGLPILEDLNQGLLDAGKVNGKLYAIPQCHNLEGLLYNKKLFADLGVKVPTNWAEMIRACETFKAAGIAPISIGTGDKFPPGWITIQLLNHAKDWDYFAGLDNGAAKFTDPVWKEIMLTIQGFAQNGYFINGHTGTSYEQSINLFAEGKAAMLVCGTWMVGQIYDITPDFDLGNFTMPYPNDRYPTRPNLNPAQCFGIHTKTTHLEECKTFLNYLYDVEAMTEYGNRSGQIVINPNAKLNVAVLNEIALEGMNGVLSLHYNSNVPMTQTLILQISGQVAMGDPVDPVLAAAQEELNIAIGK
jgi:raffinose/stachyose/melibiose transport system substrate-binding protein